LQTVVRSKGDYLPNDPQIGETTYQLTNIQRGEPPQSLFVPADYRVREEQQTVPFTTALPAPTWDGFSGLPRPNPKLVLEPTIVAPPER
jgi:hypothetical protein